ncbi:MAG TPA: hypothetical protein VKC56_06990 [Gallionellaceae bacterium]|nr:hypothetical protein [Gallionellaceae bacterium]
MNSYVRTLLRIAARLALGALLVATGAAHALDGFGQQPPSQFAFDNGDAADSSTSPWYLRYDYAFHKRRYHSLDTDNRLIATYQNVGILLEHALSYPQAPTGKLWMDRAALVIGARDPSGDSLHLGLGRTSLYGAQKDQIYSVLLLATAAISDYSAFELNLGLPTTGLREAFTSRHSSFREADAEAALDFKGNNIGLRVGWRTFAVRNAASTAGWFAGLSLYF